MKITLFKILVLLLLTVSCAKAQQTQPQQFIKMIGSEYGWPADQAQILKDIKISDLRIRQTKIIDNKNCKAGFRYVIELHGKINSDASYAIEQIINDTPNCITRDSNKLFPSLIYLNSNGGSLSDGIAIGRMFRKNVETVAVVVADDQVCASACAIAFLGSVHKHMSANGTLLFHAPYQNKFGGIICAEKTEMDYLKAYIVEMLSFRGGTSIGERIFERMMSVCSSAEGWTVNRDAAKLYKILI